MGRAARNDDDVALTQAGGLVADLGSHFAFEHEEDLLALWVLVRLLTARLARVERHDRRLTPIARL